MVVFDWKTVVYRYKLAFISCSRFLLGSDQQFGNYGDQRVLPPVREESNFLHGSEEDIEEFMNLAFLAPQHPADH